MKNKIIVFRVNVKVLSLKCFYLVILVINKVIITDQYEFKMEIEEICDSYQH